MGRRIRLKVMTKRGSVKPKLSSGKGGFNTFKIAEMRKKQMKKDG